MHDTAKSGIFHRVKKLFRRGHDMGDLPLMREIDSPITPVEAKASIWRPWAKRDHAIANLQNGFTTLADLMGAVRESLDRHNQRQDELISHLSHLPRALDLIPETSRAQAETLRAIHNQMESQSVGQRQLTAILERIGQSNTDQRRILETLRQRMDVLNEHDQMIAENLSGFASAMQSVSRNSQASTEVLGNLKDGMVARDGQIEKILVTQNARYLMLFGVTLIVSVASLAAVAILCWIMLRHPAG